MNKDQSLSAILLSLFVTFAAAATPPTSTAAPEARIPFANHDGIYNWQVVDDRTLLIQGQDRQWYKATLFSTCFDLPFTEQLGFESNPDGSFDKFSSIKVRGQTCSVTSLVKTAAPAKRVKPRPSTKKPDDAAAPPGTPKAL